MRTLGAGGVVVGMPLRRGSRSCDELQRFIELYAVSVLSDVDTPCAFWDESYTTQMASAKFKEAAKRSVLRDARSRKRGIDAVRK